MKKWLFLIIFALAAIILSLIFWCHPSLTVDNSAVKAVDLNRFMGRWYEIARYDHRFERNLTHCTTNYSIQGNGKIKITNQGIKRGKWHTSIGKGKLTDEPGVLRVSFFWFFYSDYRILMLDPDYNYALIGSSSDDHLWILARRPQLDVETCETILSEAERRGYNTQELIWVDQKPD